MAVNFYGDRHRDISYRLEIIFNFLEKLIGGGCSKLLPIYIINKL